MMKKLARTMIVVLNSDNSRSALKSKMENIWLTDNVLNIQSSNINTVFCVGC